MTQDEYVTIMEAARRCGVSDKTIQRAIRRGILPARYPQPNRSEIAVSDLEQFRSPSGQVSGQSVAELLSRVAALEQRVQDLEEQAQRLPDSKLIAKARRISSPRERLTGPLPQNLVSLLAFARLHNIAEATVQTHVNMQLLPAKHGEWADADGIIVTLALDVKGKAAFFQIYREFPMFLACKRCPHGYQDMSRQSSGNTQT